MFVTKLTVMGDSNKAYDVSVHANGVVYCTCPAWKFDSRPQAERRCKHIKFASEKLA